MAESRPGRWRDDGADALDQGRRRGGDDRRGRREEQPRNGHESHGSGTRRRSRSPGSSQRRHHHRHRDHESDRGRDRGRDRSADRQRRRRRSRDSERGRDSDDGAADAGAGATSARKQDIVKHRAPLASQQESFALESGQEAEKKKDKPNWGNTGVLAAASNSVMQADGTSTTLKYHEPSEARKPSARDQWKLFVFKGGEIVDTVDLNLRSCWLVGRDAGVVDLLAEHPSISKQHAVIQFRHIEKRNEYGDKIGRVKPYLLDLESANGTVLNDDAVPQSRYFELRHKDMILFGNSTREYVVMLAPRD